MLDLTLLRMGLFEVAHEVGGEEGQKGPLCLKKIVTHILH